MPSDSAGTPRHPLSALRDAITQGWELPTRRDPRWPFAFLLTLYCVLGFMFFGFNRTPGQMLFIMASGAVLDVVLGVVVHQKKRLPLSAWISCASLAILLNYSKHSVVLFLPVLLAIGSKYVLTLNGKHVFNPSMFGVAVSLLVGHELITAAPAYQWAGSSLTVTFFLITAAAMLFLWRIDRMWLVASFLCCYLANTAIRAWVMRHHLPPEMLFIGTFTTPPFFLFTLYMITDPQTSPKTRGMQLFIGFAIAAVDLVLHTKESVYTFFYAALIVGTVRFFIGHGRKLWSLAPQAYVRGEFDRVRLRGVIATAAIAIAYAGVAFAATFNHAEPQTVFTYARSSAADAGLGTRMSDVLTQVDPRVAHIAKWILSVGDAVAAGDIDNDGDTDIFLSNPLKDPDARARVYLNDTVAGGALTFHAMRFSALQDRFGTIDAPRTAGLVSGGTFADLDGDGDEDLLVAVGFGRSRILQNTLIPTGVLDFVDVTDEVGFHEHTVSLQMVPFDMDNDGDLDLMVLNATSPLLTDYQPPRELNIFDLPPAQYDGDRRMLRFMHNGWHDADNGGGQVFYENVLHDGALKFVKKSVGLEQRRWSLAATVVDFNHDGFSDVYVANDFGPDELLLNVRGQHFNHVIGRMFNDVGKDTYKGMNASAADFDRNGFIDVTVSNVHHALQAEGSILWMVSASNDAFVPRFSDEATTRGALNEHRFGWGAQTGDINNDGWTDIVQCNGMVDDRLDHAIDDGPWYWRNRKDYWYVNHKLMQSGPDVHTYADMWGDIRGRTIYPNEARRAYLNQGAHGAPGYFVDVAPEIAIADPDNSRGVLLSDLDADGDLDALITNQHGEIGVYQNQLRAGGATPSDAHFVSVQLLGDAPNTDGLGAVVTVRYTDAGSTQTQLQTRQAIGGFASQNDPRLHFGVGAYAGTVDVEVQWPRGNKSGGTFPVDARVQVRESPDAHAQARAVP